MNVMAQCCCSTALKQMAVRVSWQTVLPYIPEAEYATYAATHTYWQASYKKNRRTEMYYDETKTVEIRWDTLKDRWVALVTYSSDEATYEAAKAALLFDYGLGGSHTYHSGTMVEAFNMQQTGWFDDDSSELVRYDLREVTDEISGPEYIIDLSAARAFLAARSWNDIPIGVCRTWDLRISISDPTLIVADTQDYDPDSYSDAPIEGDSDVVVAYNRMYLTQAPGNLQHGTINLAYSWEGADTFLAGGPSWIQGAILRVKGVMSPHCEAAYDQLKNGPMVNTGFPSGQPSPLDYIYDADMEQPASPPEYETGEASCGQITGTQVNEPDAYQVIIIPRTNQHLFPCC